MSRLVPPYPPRRPQETVLYAVVKEHLDDFLQHARDSYARPLPKYVENEFRSYLTCGDFLRGFTVVHCEACDHHFGVAFSCKNRSVCPSCTGRRMAGEAAALVVDRILPNIPVRQYVLAFPYDLSGLAATRPEVLTYLSRVFWEALLHRYRTWAKRAGLSHARGAETGAVTGVHRAGSSLNLHVHFHTVCADGVYVEDRAGALRFEEAPAPTRAELEEMVARNGGHPRFPRRRWLKKRGLLRGDDSHEERELSPSEALAQAAMQRGTLVTVASDADEVDSAEQACPPPSPTKTDAVVFERFNLHASVRISAEDDTGRERLCRYINRPRFALGRFRRLRDGKIAYRVKKVSRHRATPRVMDPVECLARIASLVARVVPRPPTASATKSCASKRDAACGGGAGEPPTRSRESKSENSPGIGRGDGAAALAPRPRRAECSHALRRPRRRARRAEGAVAAALGAYRARRPLRHVLNRIRQSVLVDALRTWAIAALGGLPPGGWILAGSSDSGSHYVEARAGDTKVFISQGEPGGADAWFTGSDGRLRLFEIHDVARAGKLFAELPRLPRYSGTHGSDSTVRSKTSSAHIARE